MSSSFCFETQKMTDVLESLWSSHNFAKRRKRQIDIECAASSNYFSQKKKKVSGDT